MLYDYEALEKAKAEPAVEEATVTYTAETFPENITLNMSVFYNSSVRMEYTGEDNGERGKPQAEYTAANGKTYHTGDLKPVWEEIQSRLNITINDVVPEGVKNISESYTVLEEQGFAGVDIMVAPSAKVAAAGVKDGTFLNLSQYLDQMPNFSAFLQENSVVQRSITAIDGQIYYTPYFDGFDDIEQMLILRADWVRALLDDDTAVYDTEREMETYYEPYMPETLNTTVEAVDTFGLHTTSITIQYDKNIISQQNDLAVKNGETLTNTLKNYIDSTYGSQYADRSSLFIGQNAAYNADELVALMRCVLTNPMLLTGQDEMDVVPFFPREATANRIQQIYALAEIWGVRGLESRNGYLYVNESGTLSDARFDPEMMDALERLHAMYQEGLLLQDFDLDEGTAMLSGSNHRDRLLTANLGFATYDYNQTTTAYNSLADTIEGFTLLPVLPPVADWDGNGNYYRFTASWRSVKSDCWAILASVAEDEEKLARCLALFDYMYAPEGNRLMSYGPEAWIDGTIVYYGGDVPKLSAAALTELNELADGNYTNYYRMWLGATFPIGYVKEQGMEFQTLQSSGQEGLTNILRACRLGVMRHLVVSDEEQTSPTDAIMPSTIPLTEAESEHLSEVCADLSNAFETGSDSRVIFTDYVKYGFEGENAEGQSLLSKDGLRTYLYHDLNGEEFLAYYQTAYDRMNDSSR